MARQSPAAPVRDAPCPARPDGGAYTAAMKVVMVLMLLAVLAALGSAGFFMLRRRPGPSADAAPVTPPRQMAWALALRVGLSVALFLFLLLSWWMGWVKPTGLPAAS